ncbi:hybrid sensor histidine kinase/response regulator [Paraburkholderia edwinii]|uniref:histidine kinase n=1 Tax=Paraburkholderia edwinii TaxID=2861782 RepID=A0ABX8V471_9BURK|nr:hybrid sensor histidine kinase/response regulator [Paraburkholderia edwinii]QYD73870.1 hybrid sensor histidine kinase/response regulator [Paraburkholderia edwinii]
MQPDSAQPSPQASTRRASHPWRRRIVYVLIWLTALAAPTAAIGYLLYATLLSPRVTQLAESYDGVYWDAAQLQIAYARLESQLLQYETGIDGDYAQLRLQYHVLQSKLRVMAGSTRQLAARQLAGKAAHTEEQQREIQTLTDMLAALEPTLDALPRDPMLADKIVLELRRHWEEINHLALSRRTSEVANRTALNTDFVAKRRMLFAAGLVLLLLSAAASVQLVVNARRRTKLIRQQRAALDAEHQATRAAREASLAKDAFLGMISHELRTPLHAIVSSIELLGFNFHSEADRKVIRRLEVAARQLETQMKDLTDYARLGAGKLELRDEQFDPRDLLASVVDESEPAANARGLAFASSAGGAVGLVESDPHRIRQIVTNLVTNAIRYTEKGTVTLRFEQRSDALVIVVGDTGPGVPSAQIPLIFKEFTRLDESRARRFDGAGMGLAIVQGLVDLFGGELVVDSRVGLGSTFTVTIPVKPVAPPAAASIAARAQRRTARPRVLVVDDNQLVRESLCEMVEHMGYEGAAVGGVDAAFAWLETQQCELILLDLQMPGKDGYAFIGAFNADDARARSVPVIAVTAYAPELQTHGAAHLFFDCLTKPVHYDVLHAAVHRALAAQGSTAGGAATVA